MNGAYRRSVEGLPIALLEAEVNFKVATISRRGSLTLLVRTC